MKCQLVLGDNCFDKVDGSVAAKVTVFFKKLCADDSSPALRVKPLEKMRDRRVRTGRIDDFWRAVMFCLEENGQRTYVVHGIFKHDEAIRVAQSIKVGKNAHNQQPEIDHVIDLTEGGIDPVDGYLTQHGYLREELEFTLGLSVDHTNVAMRAATSEEIRQLAAISSGWPALALSALAGGQSIADILESLGSNPGESPTHASGTAASEGVSDAEVLQAMREHNGSTFHFLHDHSQLERALTCESFAKWQIFLHPEQQRYVDLRTHGPFRLSGGAGTGKTVVLLHRTRRLAQQNPDARIILATYTSNLANMMRTQLLELDPDLAVATALGEAGIQISGVDALARAILNSCAGMDQGDQILQEAAEAVLGQPAFLKPCTQEHLLWREATKAVPELAEELRDETFLSNEYDLVLLPNRVRSEQVYRRTPRLGRGNALPASVRSQLWPVFTRFRELVTEAQSRTFSEWAAIAASALTKLNAPPLAVDHVLIDEGQDLKPVHWQMLRALAKPGSDDLFIAEDAQQRLYLPPVKLSQLGIHVVGRSRRLTLNYRTTAENLAYGITLLQGGGFEDLEGQLEPSLAFSARSGPKPEEWDVADESSRLEAITQIVQDWLEEDSAAGRPTGTAEIAVLAHTRSERDRVLKALHGSEINAEVLDQRLVSDVPVVVLTIHRAKGMEFRRTVLLDPERVRRKQVINVTSPQEAERERQARSLRYVAATRARDEIAIVH